MRIDEKLYTLIVGKIMEEEFERDSEAEAEAEAEQSKVMGKGEVKEAGGTQETNMMEVDNTREDEVIVADDSEPSRVQKHAPSLPPKPSGKRVCAMMVAQVNAGSQEKVGVSCEQCVQYGIMCILTGEGMRCEKCQVKHH